MEELQDELERLEQEQAKIQSQINSIKNDKSKQQEYKNALLQQVNNTKSQIAAYNNSIATVEKNIAEAEASIAQKEAQLADLKWELRKRLRDICMNGGDTNNALLAVLLNSESFSEILTAIEYSKNMANKDERVMNEIADTIKLIEQKQVELEADRAALVEFKSTLDAKKASLDAQVTEANRVLASLNQSESQLNNYYAQLEKEAEKVEEAIRLAALGGNTSVFNGTFSWPLPGKKSDYRLTSPISAARPHPVYGTIRAHTGNDYANSGIAGKPIYAAAAGTVSIASYDDGGFGWFIMINHGKYNGSSYSTLYAHMTRYVVKQGQTVKKGDIIGYVGMSGAATGYHLHLEVRVNGVPVDPDPYFK